MGTVKGVVLPVKRQGGVQYRGGVQVRLQAGGGRGNSKNSTNHERGSISKVINRMAESIVTGGASEEISMMTMLSNQINQQSMQQQMFQHSLKMQMDALEKKGDMREVYILLK